MSFVNFPTITDITQPMQLAMLLRWLEEVYRALDTGLTGEYELDASASGKVSKIYLRNGLIYKVDLVP